MKDETKEAVERVGKTSHGIMEVVHPLMRGWEDDDGVPELGI